MSITSMSAYRRPRLSDDKRRTLSLEVHLFTLLAPDAETFSAGILARANEFGLSEAALLEEVRMILLMQAEKHERDAEAGQRRMEALSAFGEVLKNEMKPSETLGAFTDRKEAERGRPLLTADQIRKAHNEAIFARRDEDEEWERQQEDKAYFMKRLKEMGMETVFSLAYRITGSHDFFHQYEYFDELDHDPLDAAMYEILGEVYEQKSAAGLTKDYEEQCRRENFRLAMKTAEEVGLESCIYHMLHYVEVLEYLHPTVAQIVSSQSERENDPDYADELCRASRVVVERAIAAGELSSDRIVRRPD